MGCSKLGISYAVVTKVKELTEAKQYGEALDLLEGEDIFQSFNPQFLRCCGEVYMENDRFYESREALVRAHIMAPEGNRIIYDLVQLYLRMGYFHRARKYYEIYEHNATAEDTGAKFLLYMIKKAQRVEAGELLGILEAACEEQYSDEWGFELALLYASLGKKDKMKEECIHLMASFRNSPYCALADSLKKGEYDISNSNFRFPIMEAEEDVETYASILALEEKQLEKDELKVHPPDPVILQMEDDDETEETSHSIKEKVLGFKLPFGKKRSKNVDAVETEQESEQLQEQKAVEDGKEQETVPEEVLIAGEKQEESVSLSEQVQVKEIHTDVLQEENTEDVSAYIESVMKSVADIEASVAEDLNQPIKFYQPKLFDVEESLSPKERLEQLMKLIEEDRQSSPVKKQSEETEEELDLDEFLTNLVGANSITQAMVKNYRNEKESDEKTSDGED